MRMLAAFSPFQHGSDVAVAGCCCLIRYASDAHASSGRVSRQSSQLKAGAVMLGSLTPLTKALYTCRTLACSHRLATAPAGASEEQMAQLRSFTCAQETAAMHSASASPCPICLCAFAAGDRLSALHCGHQHHQACLAEWLRLSACCPICKCGLRSSADSSPSVHAIAPDAAEDGSVALDGSVQARQAAASSYEQATQHVQPAGRLQHGAHDCDAVQCPQDASRGGMTQHSACPHVGGSRIAPASQEGPSASGDCGVVQSDRCMSTASGVGGETDGVTLSTPGVPVERALDVSED